MNTMKHLPACAVALAVAALLPACGGGGGGTAPGTTAPDGGGQPPADGPVRFSGAGDSMAARISDAGTLGEATTFRARAVGIDRTSGEGNALADGGDVAIRIFRSSPDAMPTFVVTLDGGATTFGPEHAYGNGNYRIHTGEERRERWLWTWDGSPLEHAAGYRGDFTDGNVFVPGDRPKSRKHHIPVGLYYSGDPTDVRRAAVIGLETAPGDMPTRGRARYSGSVRLDIYPVDGGERTYLSSDITLTADFSGNTIGGTMDSWENRTDPDDDLSGVSYVVTPAALTGNAFTTTLARGPSCPDCPEVISSTVTGKLYGPAAQEMGGTIQFRSRGEEDRIGIGVFYTDRE